MDYKVGISTGFWNVRRDPSLLGLATKIAGLGATGGIKFVQIDLETIAEFFEPDVKKEIERMKQKLGMYAGLHGEIGQIMALDSAEKNIWDQTHNRLVLSVKNAADLGFFYVNIHFSNRQFLSTQEAQLRIYGTSNPVVDPQGKGLQHMVGSSKTLQDYVVRHTDLNVIDHAASVQKAINDERNEKHKEEQQRIDEAMKRLAEQDPRIRDNPELARTMRGDIAGRIHEQMENDLARTVRSNDFLIKCWLNLKSDEFERYLLRHGEFGAYHIAGKCMHESRDPLWMNIVGDREPEKAYFDDEKSFSAAIAGKYIEGHLIVKDNETNKKHLEGMSVKEWCEKKGIYLLLESPESGQGVEGMYRLYDPMHFYQVIKSVNSPMVKITLDFEHMVSQMLNPDVELPKLPDDFGKYVLLLHLGQAVPYGGTAHIPVSRGSIAQEQIYKWAYILRKKGFKSGYMLFERGGGRTGSGNTPLEVFEDSVAAIRQIAKYLELDVEPKKLPAEFYGISFENPGVFAKQEVAIRDHAQDPLEGLLSVPEEKHTFLSGVMVQRQKGQEWEKRKHR
jgi:sugar phosphate isomerase/epimerase